MMVYNQAECKPSYAREGAVHVPAPETGMPVIDTVERPATLKAVVLARLREAITLGRLRPGERLVERVLCAELGVSRTVVRECIRHLESEWLVTVRPNAGPTVAVLDADEVREVYELRVLLEGAAVRACAARADTPTVERLEALCGEIAAALDSDEIIAALAATRRFYETLFLCGGRTVSWDLVERLNGRIGRLRALTLASAGRRTSGPASLRRIVEAIARGDGDAAARACETHLAEASRLALELLEDSRQ